MRPYVGIRLDNGKREVFWSPRIPTERTHGDRYAAAIGPFETMRGARYMAAYGYNNPHLPDVRAAEYYAALDAGECPDKRALVA